jgi:hypothetical protein
MRIIGPLRGALHLSESPKLWHVGGPNRVVDEAPTERFRDQPKSQLTAAWLVDGLVEVVKIGQ